MMARVCNHDNVVQFIGVILPPLPSVVTRFMARGSVEDVMVKPGPRNTRDSIPFVSIVLMAKEAAAGVLHLHCENVIHRDLGACAH
jgi:serine/threonine protein kinase